LSKVEVNEIDKQSGSTLTIGGSGTTVQLGTGASQSGFGRTGTVDWQTTKKTADFTAANGEGYFVDSSSLAITVTLPASPSAGNIVSVSDYNQSAGSNTITIARNGSNINGSAANYDITKGNSAVTFVYVDATAGWTGVQTSNPADNQSPFIVASGGTETTSGDFKIHTFTGPGTFTVSKTSCTPAENTVGYMVVAGGGGGGLGPSNSGGGGGAGGFREGRNVPVDNFTASPLVADAPTNAITVTATSFPITVGGGGAGITLPSAGTGNNGSNSVFSTITSTGGGGGGAQNDPGPGNSGGSGGGSAFTSSGSTGGSGNTPSVSPPQGNSGGNNANDGGSMASTGGGGAGGSSSPVPQNAGPGPSRQSAGGNGVSSSITGASVTRAGGGGANIADTPACGAAGGPGGGGKGGTAGTANTGGGGGGGNTNPTSSPSGAGGSGIVIIRYKFQ
jgi:hypothetical protein